MTTPESQQEQIVMLRKVLRDLLAEVDQNTCIHEEVYRGGYLWTICRACGRKWADDQGGFKLHEDSPAVQAARNALDAAMTRDALRHKLLADLFELPVWVRPDNQVVTPPWATLTVAERDLIVEALRQWRPGPSEPD